MLLCWFLNNNASCTTSVSICSYIVMHVLSYQYVAHFPEFQAFPGHTLWFLFFLILLINCSCAGFTENKCPTSMTNEVTVSLLLEKWLMAGHQVNTPLSSNSLTLLQREPSYQTLKTIHLSFWGHSQGNTSLCWPCLLNGKNHLLDNTNVLWIEMFFLNLWFQDKENIFWASPHPNS